MNNRGGLLQPVRTTGIYEHAYISEQQVAVLQVFFFFVGCCSFVARYAPHGAVCGAVRSVASLQYAAMHMVAGSRPILVIM